jgi:hypothetical protein
MGLTGGMALSSIRLGVHAAEAPVTALRLRRVQAVGIGAATLVALGAVIAASSVAGSGPPATKGHVAQGAFNGGGIDLSLAPDFIEALGPTGDVVGYIPKAYFANTAGPVIDGPLGADGRPVSPDMPVYADDLTTLVGHHVPGVGFVPLGTDSRAVPTFVVEAAPSP